MRTKGTFQNRYSFWASRHILTLGAPSRENRLQQLKDEAFGPWQIQVRRGSADNRIECGRSLFRLPSSPFGPLEHRETRQVASCIELVPIGAPRPLLDAADLRRAYDPRALRARSRRPSPLHGFVDLTGLGSPKRRRAAPRLLAVRPP